MPSPFLVNCGGVTPRPPTPGMSPGLRNSTLRASGASTRNVTRRSAVTSGETTMGPGAAPRPCDRGGAGERSKPAQSGSTRLADVFGDVQLAPAFAAAAVDPRERASAAGEVGVPDGRP